jgi:hypothetical protein
VGCRRRTGTRGRRTDGSIKTREETQQKAGEASVSDVGTGTGAAHRVRIEYERDLLRAIRKKLSGT